MHCWLAGCYYDWSNLSPLRVFRDPDRCDIPVDDTSSQT